MEQASFELLGLDRFQNFCKLWSWLHACGNEVSTRDERLRNQWFMSELLLLIEQICPVVGKAIA